MLSVVIMNDKYIGSGQTRIYGYVQVASKSDGQNAVIGLQFKNLKGKLIELVEALPLSDKRPDKILPASKATYLNPKTRQR